MASIHGFTVIIRSAMERSGKIQDTLLRYFYSHNETYVNFQEYFLETVTLVLRRPKPLSWSATSRLPGSSEWGFWTACHGTRSRSSTSRGDPSEPVHVAPMQIVAISRFLAEITTR